MKSLSRRAMAGKGNIKRRGKTRAVKVNQVLRDAYSLYFRDKHTRRALRQCLG